MRLVRYVAIAVAGFLMIAGLASPASGSADVIGVHDYAFSPTPYLGTLGGAVEWTNTGVVGVGHAHQPVQDAPLNLWSDAAIAPGASTPVLNLTKVGTFTYHCAIHPSMHGSVKVPVTTNISSGAVGDKIQINLASGAHPKFTFDVSRKIGTGSWTPLRSGVSGNSVTMTATVAGTYLFKAKLVRTKAKTKPASGWSPSAAVTIS